MFETNKKFKEVDIKEKTSDSYEINKRAKGQIPFMYFHKIIFEMF